MGLSSFLLNRDTMGHPIMLNYKGRESFPTMVGAILSLVIKALVL